MKNKPTRHKDTNTFKFQPFSERISQLDVDVFHRIGHRNEEFNEDETFFHQTLQKWNVLNLSESYEEFRKELPSVETLPLLLNQQDVIIEVILRHLSKRNPLAIEALLDLLAALMRDLRHEVYSSYSTILQQLCELLSSKNADELEWTFTCLAYMFKYLWRYFVKDADSVFDNVVPLFSESKPQYIRNFAAECFAFVVRKVKNKKDFIKLILRTLESRPDGEEGCGKLLFEVLRGIKGRFHSFAHDFLPLTLEMLYDNSLNVQLLYKVLKHMFRAICSSIEKKYFHLVWDTIFEILSKYNLENDEHVETHVVVLELLKEILEYRNGSILSESQTLVPHILKVVGIVRHETLCKILSESVAIILLSPRAQLTQENARYLTLNMLKMPYKDTILDFICKILPYSGFETFILPWVQSYVTDEFESCVSVSSRKACTNAVNLLSRIILTKTSPCIDGMHLEHWKRYPLDLNITVGKGNSKEKSCIFEALFERRCNLLLPLSENNMEEIISMLLILPHVNIIKREIVVDKLKNLMEDLCSILKSFRDDKKANENIIQKSCFLFLFLVQALVHITSSRNVEAICSKELILDVVLQFAGQSVSALSAVDLYLTAIDIRKRDKLTQLQILKKVSVLISDCLASPYHRVRLLTSHILSLFSSLDSNSLDFLQSCFDAELVTVTIQNYREKLMHLEKLSCDSIKANDEFLEIPCKFLLGVLYENFQWMWEPVIHLVASYAKGMTPNCFWKIFGAKLEQAKQNVNEQQSLVVYNCSFNNCILGEMFTSVNNRDDRPDFSNYRILLWKAFVEFPELCEVKSRDVSPLFLNFLEDEYFMANSIDLQYCSVIITDPSGNQKEIIKEENGITERREQDDKEKRNEMYNTLVAHMKLFAKVRNPKSLYKEAQLRESYLVLLTHKNTNIQKLALECLMAYKEKYLIPYSEHLFGLLNDKTFKDEITLFHIGKENSVVQEEHRAELIPILLRMLCGRMLTRASRSSTGKGPAELKQSMVLRFLSECEDNEKIIFLKLAFKAYQPYLCHNAKSLVEVVSKNINLKKVISLKSLRGSLNLLLTVMDRFGALMGNEVLSSVLHILICIGSVISCILVHRSEIHAAYASGLRTLQSTSILAVVKFFSQFTKYPWKEDEIDNVFQVFVWTGLDRLHIEGIHSPTALLKLLFAWSQCPKYFYLLTKCKGNGDDLTPLGAVMKLLQSPKIQSSVSSTVMQMLEALLTTADSDGDHDEESFHQDGKVIKNDPEEINYGSKILLPHISAIIEHLVQKLHSRKKKGLGSRDLLVLSHICKLVTNSETSESLLNLIFLAFFKTVSGPEQTIIHLVSTVCSLMRNVPSPFKYLKCVAPLFGTVSSVDARRMLCDVLSEFTERDTCLNKALVSKNVLVVKDINAWDTKWVEQPDFCRRLDALKVVHEMLEGGEIILEFGVIIVYNCFYFLKHEKDMALRDSSGFCLRKLCPYLCKQSVITNNSQVPDTILKLIISGVREKSNDGFRNEVISLLGEMVRECNNSHPVLLDLKDLVCKDDPEVDFFNNIIHLQSHRRARALMKFCSIAMKMTKPPKTQTLSQIILPLVSPFLCSDKYARKKNIVDAAVQTIGVVCNLLPWFHYETILKHYLHKLHTEPLFQKQLVSVVVSILEGFHFDISSVKSVDKTKRCALDQTTKQKDKKEIQEEKLVEKATNESEFEIPLKKIANEGIFMDDENSIEVERKIGDEGSQEAKNEILSASCQEVAPKSSIEELEDVLDKVSDHELEVEERNIPDLQEQVPYVSQFLKLSEGAATRITRSITERLMPHLQRTVCHLNKKELVHKVNRKRTASEQEEEDTRRIPIAFAIVKLLQRLPLHFLEQYLPNVFLNLCAFLKSRLESVRRVAREMLQKIMASLGPSYLHVLLSEMMALLTKGYQLHVLIYTIHSILSSMKSTFKTGDMDSCLTQVLEICKIDLFGKASEEKKVSKITGKVSEARSHKSYDTLNIAAQFISEKCLVDLLIPFKEVLSTTYSYSTIVNVSECLRRIVNGLYENRFVSVESLLIFVYGISSGSIEALKIDCSKNKLNAETQQSFKQPDSFVIPQAPRTRYGEITAKPNISQDRNAHIFVDFGLSLLHILLKRGKATSQECAIYFDPFVPVLQRNIDAKHVKLTTTALKCLTCLFKTELPNLKQNVSLIADSIFRLLHKYSTAGLVQGEYMDMVIAAFRAVTVLVRDVKYYVINELQLKALLLYVEHDMESYTKRATAFPLLKAILSRKLEIPEVYEVMKKVARLSILSSHDHVRGQARLIFYHFLMNYPLGHKLEYHINFYVSQMKYELEPGRISAFQIIHRLIATFPDQALSNYAGIFFVALGASLVNDDKPNCKKLAAKCLKTLINRDEKDREKLFDITLRWMEDKNIRHRTLGAQVCGLFVEVEGDACLRRVQNFLPILLKQLSSKIDFPQEPGKSLCPTNELNEECEDPDNILRLKDHCLFQILRLVKKICSHCPSFLRDESWSGRVNDVAETAQQLLGHPHEWIRLEASAVLGHIFASLDINLLVEAVVSSSFVDGRYLFSNTVSKLKSLVLDFCAQLIPDKTGPLLIEQVTKNLAFLCRVIKSLTEVSEELDVDGVKISLLWFIRRMRKVVNMEVVLTPYSFTLREAVFKWLGALLVDLTKERLQPLISQILTPLARELLNENESSADLLHLAKAVTKILKRKLGMEEYTSQLSKVQVHLATKRAKRKRERIQEIVHNPEVAARRKIRKHEKKKLVKKRKIDEWKGKIAPKRKRKLENVDNVEPGQKWEIGPVS